MFLNCDLTSAFEDGGIGGIVMAVVWGLWTWWKSHSQKQQAQKS